MKVNFTTFLEERFPYFRMDAAVHSLLRLLDLHAHRNPKFNKEAVPLLDLQENLHLDKGWLILGNVGAGKSDLLRLYWEYLRSLDSPYVFNRTRVWTAADDYQLNGVAVFPKLETSNWLFDELALLDPKTGYPDKEAINYYGNKILMGSELIRRRYEALQWQGYQTHFITNCTVKQLTDFYGEANMSRLAQMCNIITYVGDDRRRKAAPVIFFNRNQPFKPVPEAYAKLANEENGAGLKSLLNNLYTEYCQTGNANGIQATHYEFLVELGADILDKATIDSQLKPMIREGRKQYAACTMIGKNADETKRLRVLRQLYALDDVDEQELATIHRLAYKRAVILYFDAMKNNSAKVLFQ